MLFISHSTLDKAFGLDLLERLGARGYACNQTFLDSDQRSGIKLGNKWERVLYDNLRECQALLVLCSPSWAQSRWCFAELAVAKMRSIEVFPIVLADCDLTAVSEYQLLRLDVDDPAARERVFDRLFRDLDDRGLGPRDLLPWPNPALLDAQGAIDSCPFPGLPSFDERYTSVYCGRERETRDVLAELGTMRIHGEPRLLMIVGGSGSGKSSLLLAGVLPRLRHPTSAEAWLVLPTLRPQRRTSATALVETLTESLLDLNHNSEASSVARRRAELVTDLSRADPAEAARAFRERSRDLCLARNVPQATVLLPIDQFEELLGTGAVPGSVAFLAFLAEVCRVRDDRLVVVATMRSDSLDTFEHHRHTIPPPSFATWRLGPFPSEQVANVIVEPAKRAGVDVASELLERLKQDTVRSDSTTTDALPLLAFTLEKLFRAYERNGKLELADYQALGGIEGAITRTAAGIMTEAAPAAQVKAAVRASFVIHLAQINERTKFERRTARWEDLDPLARPILEKFVAQRLLVMSTRGTERTVEVAHEAMFRCWSQLEDWLRVSADISLWRRDVARDREAARVAGKTWQGLTDGQFAVAAVWPRSRRVELQEQEIGWIRQAARRARRRQIAYVALAVILAGLMLWARRAEYRAKIEAGERRSAEEQALAAARTANTEAAERKVAEEKALAAARTANSEAAERRIAEEKALAAAHTANTEAAERKVAEEKALAEACKARSGEYAAKSRALVESDPRAASLLAVEALHATPGVPEPVAVEALSKALADVRGIPLHGPGRFRGELQWPTCLATATGRRLLVGNWDGSVHVWRFDEKGTPIRERVLIPELGRYAGSRVESAPVTNLAISGDGRWAAVVTGSSDSSHVLRIVDLDGAAPPAEPAIHVRVVANARRDALALLRRGGRVIEILDLTNPTKRPRPVMLTAHDRLVRAMTFSSDGRLLSLLDDAGHVIVHDLSTPTSRPRTAALNVFGSLPSAWPERKAFLDAFPPDDLRLGPGGRYLVVLAELPSNRVQPQRMAEVWDMTAVPPAVVASFPRTQDEFGTFDAGDGNLVTEIALSPDARHMVLGHNRELRIWDLAKATPAESPTRVLELTHELSAMAISPDGRSLVLADSRGHVSSLGLSALATSTLCTLTSNDASGWSRDLLFDRSSDRVFAASDADVTWVLEPTASSVHQTSPPELLPKQVVHVARCGRFAAAICRSGLWISDLATGTTKCLELPQDVLTAESPLLHLSPNGGVAVVSSGSSTRLYLVALAPGLKEAHLRPIQYPEPARPNFTFDDAEQWLAVHGGEVNCCLVPLASAAPLRELPDSTGEVMFSPDGGWLLTGALKRFQQPTPTKPLLWRLGPEPVPLDLPGATLDALESWTFDPQGRWLAASEGGRSWERRDSRVFVWPLGAPGPSAAVAVRHTMSAETKFSSDGRWMVTFDALPGALDEERSTYLPKRVRLWRPPEFEQVHWEDSYRVQSLDVEFSPNSRWLTIGSDGSLQAKLIDLRPDPVGSAPAVIESGATLVGDWRFTFSPDGRWFTTHGFNAPVRLWRFDPQDRPELIEDDLADGLLDRAGQVAFSPDQRTLALCNQGTTRVFWLAPASPLRRLSLTGGGVPSYDTASSRLFVNEGSAVRVVELNPFSSLPLIAGWVGRNLTWSEWNREFPGRTYAKTFSHLPSHVSVVAASLERGRSAALAQRPEEARRAYANAAAWAVDAGHADAANSVCWSGCEDGFAAEVLPAGEFAVRTVPSDGNFRNTRGVARCLVGDTDGALEDLEAFVAWAREVDYPNDVVTERLRWIADLRAGRRPQGLPGDPK